jgi:hypothetical protein
VSVLISGDHSFAIQGKYVTKVHLPDGRADEDIALSPPATLPDGSSGREVEKFHLCASCWQEFRRWLDQGRDSR